MGNTSTQTKKMNSYLATTLTLLLTMELGSCGHYYYKRPTKSVFNSLVSDSRFSTLVAAVTAAGLTEEAINDLGPLTVFAPTNEAFAKIPSDALLRHVVPGKTVKLYKSAQSVDNAGGSKVTVNGYTVTTSAASAMVIGKVSATDGIIYAIDSVV